MRHLDPDSLLHHNRHIMRITALMTDKTVLIELGTRLAARRLAANVTQLQLAKEAGVSRSTVHRLENGIGAVQMSSLIRVCRSLGVLEEIGACFVGAGEPGPMDALRISGKRGVRERARAKCSPVAPSLWKWGTK